MPARFNKTGDRHQDIDAHPCVLDALLDLAARHEKEGLRDAPWPPQYQKMPGEPPRVQPSRARKAAGAGAAPEPVAGSTGRRVPKYPLIEIARADRREDALAEVEAWKQRHPQVATLLEPSDVLVDAMRGRSSTWTRVRVNLKNVPESLQKTLQQKPARARKRS